MKNISKSMLLFVLLSFRIECLLASKVTFLSELEEHRTLLKKALKTAEESITIVSPYISHNALTSDEIPSLIRAAQSKGVKITVYTDSQFDMLPSNSLKERAKLGRDILKDLFCDLHIVKKVHAKTLIVDDIWIATGSFNWLSASRNQFWANLEHSVIIEPDEEDTEDKTDDYIKKAKTSIEALEEVDHPYKEFYEKYTEGVFVSDPENLILWISNHLQNFSFENQKYFSDKIVYFQKKYYPSNSEEGENPENSNSSKGIEEEDKKDFIKNLKNIVLNELEKIYNEL